MKNAILDLFLFEIVKNKNHRWHFDFFNPSESIGTLIFEEQSPQSFPKLQSNSVHFKLHHKNKIKIKIYDKYKSSEIIVSTEEIPQMYAFLANAGSQNFITSAMVNFPEIITYTENKINEYLKNNSITEHNINNNSLKINIVNLGKNKKYLNFNALSIKINYNNELIQYQKFIIETSTINLDNNSIDQNKIKNFLSEAINFEKPTSTIATHFFLQLHLNECTNENDKLKNKIKI